jgi:hypothetical protein
MVEVEVHLRAGSLGSWHSLIQATSAEGRLLADEAALSVGLGQVEAVDSHQTLPALLGVVAHRVAESCVVVAL